MRHLLRARAHARQLRGAKAAQVDIVKAHDAQFSRHFQPQAVGGFHCAQRHHIAGRDQRARPRLSLIHISMALGAVYEGDFWDFFCGKAVPQAHLPVGTVLTIAASGSESSNSAVITKDETREKRGLNVELNRPVYALMNPEWTRCV